MSDPKGFLKLPRKFQEDPIWTERRTFSKAEAWIDMLFQARYSRQPQEVMLGLKTYTCGRGECLRSMHTWAERWGWSVGKVRRFFQMLQKRNMIAYTTDSQTTHVKIVIYEDYSRQRHTNENQTTHKRNSNGNQTESEEEGGKKDGRKGKKQQDAARRVVQTYIDLVGRPGDANTKQARRNVEKLLKAGHTEAELIAYARNYAAGDDFPGDPQYRYKASNFFGRAAQWEAYTDEAMASKSTPSRIGCNSKQFAAELEAQGVIQPKKETA